jgi:hypothetical protein
MRPSAAMSFHTRAFFLSLSTNLLQQIGNVLNALRLDPHYLAYAIATQFELRYDKRMMDLCSVVVCSLYRNCFSPKEERYFLMFMVVRSDEDEMEYKLQPRSLSLF